MPLVITLVAFGVLFAFEACAEVSVRADHERALRRYEMIEHPRRNRLDAYVDQLS